MSRLLLRARGMAVLRGVLASPVSKHFLALLGLLAARRPDPTAVAGPSGGCGRSSRWSGASSARRLEVPPRGPSAGRRERFLSRCREGEASPALVEQTSRDLRTLRRLFDLEAEPLLNVVEDAVPGLEGVWVPWTDPERGRHLVPAPRAGPQARGGGGLGEVCGAARGSLLPPWRGFLRASRGVPLGRGRPQGRGRARPRAPRRPRRVRAGTGAAAHEHRALPRRPPGASRAPLRHAGDGEVFNRQGRAERVRRPGVAARRGGEGGSRSAVAGAGESARPRAALRHLR